MSFVSVTMTLMAGFVILVPLAMAAIVLTGGRPVRRALADAVPQPQAAPTTPAVSVARSESALAHAA